MAESAACALPALAADLGYADQAHLTREFAALSGVTPSRSPWTRLRAERFGEASTKLEKRSHARR
jgi:AraC-like DNA-binding protein